MLPIVRLIPVGGVLFAIVVLALGFAFPAAQRTRVPPFDTAERGPLTPRIDGPRLHRFAIRATSGSAGAMGDFGTAADAPESATKFAGLPATRTDSGPDDQTGSITQSPNSTIPLGIGESSSTELPVTGPEDLPPAIKMPERARQTEAPRPAPAPAPMYRVYKGPPALPQPSSHFGFLFGTGDGRAGLRSRNDDR